MILIIIRKRRVFNAHLSSTTIVERTADCVCFKIQKSTDRLANNKPLAVQVVHGIAEFLAGVQYNIQRNERETS